MLMMAIKVKTRLTDLLEGVPEIIVNFYLHQSDLKSMTVELKTIKGLNSLVEGQMHLVPNETIDLAIACITDPKLLERLCEQIERCRTKVEAFS